MSEQNCQPCSVADFERFARAKLPSSAAGYYRSGACGEHTLAFNQSAFQRIRIRPRVLRDVSTRDMAVTIQGREVKVPIGVAPTAMQKMAHPDGECANARAVGRAGSVFILSTLSTSSIEEVAAAAPDTIKWFQLYVYKDRELTKKLVARAEAAGFKALVLTVDASAWGMRYADARNKFILPPHLKLANFSGNLSSGVSEKTSGSALQKYIEDVFDLNITWDDVKWLKRITKLPVMVKGVLTAEDAKIAADIGVGGVIVSNHGGRQLDTSPASIEALPEISKAVGDRVEVYLDGGIRYGTDVFKALALGAKMVFVGRPAVWGLTYNGEEGVKKVLDILGNEFDTTLALAGCRSPADIRSDMVTHESTYSKL
ncbi:unnamed protein product [Nezara viridula]|uniref:(S)-2-hydroxy-acid oxidase n=1 Tax=Nezara viridula TaxID=85310 RepID=A0A9P0MW99_NEZVI|nr:unnamed protein product [Nezara viridula]